MPENPTERIGDTSNAQPTRRYPSRFLTDTLTPDPDEIVTDSSNSVQSQYRVPERNTNISKVHVSPATTITTTIEIHPTTSASTNELSSENLANRERLQLYNSSYTTQLLRLIADTDLEYGFSSALDSFLRERLTENAAVTKEWLNQVFIRHFHDVPTITGILRTIAHFDYTEMAPSGPTMSLAALTHRNAEVRECGIRTLENWGTLECLKILEQANFQESWLQEYVTQVISDLRREFATHVSLG